MKNTIIIGVMVATILIAGCDKKNSSSSSSDTTKPATQIAKQQIVIKIASDKTLLVADKPCLQNELVARVTQLVTNRSAEVVIRATNADDDQVKAIADACKKAGVHEISYALVRF
jgi:biopolymer transport protein ExbD